MAVGACALAAGITACGGGSSGGNTSGSGGTSAASSADNGVAGKSPDQIFSTALSTAESAKSVHVSGSGSSGETISGNLDLVPGGGSGQLTSNGVSFRLIYLNKTVYVNGSDAFWKKSLGNSAAQLLHGRWLKAPSTNSQFGSVAQLADERAMFSSLLSNHGKLVKGATSTIAGQKVIAVNDTTNKATLYVATTGKPYPIQFSGATQGRFEFDRYDKPVTVTAPPNVLDATKVGSS